MLPQKKRSGSGSGIEEYRPWVDLPFDLLRAISKRLTSIQHYLSFRAVCPSWRCAATFHNFDRQLPRVPRLIFFVQMRVVGPRVTNFLDLATYSIKIPDFPPAIHYPYLSCFGWLLRFSKHSIAVRLTHHIRLENIHLPCLNTFPGYQQKSHLPIIRKMVLSSSPDLVIMVIWGDGGQLAFCRPGDESWTIMDTWDAPFSDIIYDDTKLYAVDSRLRIVQFDIHGSNPIKRQQVFSLPRVVFADEATRRMYCRDRVVHHYLVKSSGKFLIVCRYISQDITYDFRVVEIEVKDGSFVEIHNLRGRCLFLGLNSSISADFPESSNTSLKRDCIYFTNTIEQCCYPGMGVYSFGDMATRNLVHRSGFCFPIPTMVVPTL